MQGHRGLPKNLPQRKVRARIISTGASPNHTSESPSKSGSIYKSSPNKTPDRESSLNRSQHRLKSKQKPITCNPLLSTIQKRQMESSIKVNTFDDKVQWNEQQQTVKKKQQNQPTQFVQAVLGMMGKLGRSQPVKLKADSRISKNINNLLTEQTQNRSSVNNKLIPMPKQIYEIKQYKYSNPAAPLRQSKANESIIIISDQQLLAKCIQLLNDRSSWQTYSGQMAKNNVKAGYGILYFKNNCKFMGAFQDDRAHGHGTFYDYEQEKRVMGVWDNNRIKNFDQYFVQKL